MIIDKNKILDLYDIEISCLEISENLGIYNEHNKELIRIADLASNLRSYMNGRKK
tara:strand:- start:79 stop:243 length:165 start_codon:yes stop_codon:yes gene_type:complete